jgi:hypothetical protein
VKGARLYRSDPGTDNEAAHGGMKSSGNGRELGVEGLEDFRQTGHVYIDTKVDAKSWWYPYSEHVRYEAQHGMARG